jgi:hemoglobin
MNDILDRNDIQQLVNRFYDKVKSDPLLGSLFAHVDWPVHLPTMYNFWSSMMLGEQSYRGNPLAKHVPLGVQPEHFERWLQLFRATVSENFEGEKAEEIVARAGSIAMVWQHKLGLLERRI